MRVSLHTGDPGEIGGGIADEANYDGYRRVEERFTGRGTIGDNFSEVEAVACFPQCTGGFNRIRFFGLIADGVLVDKGELEEELVVGNGVMTELTIKHRSSV